MGGTCGAFPAVANKKEMIALFHFHFEERLRASYYAIARVGPPFYHWPFKIRWSYTCKYFSGVLLAIHDSVVNR